MKNYQKIVEITETTKKKVLQLINIIEKNLLEKSIKITNKFFTINIIRKKTIPENL